MQVACHDYAVMRDACEMRHGQRAYKYRSSLSCPRAVLIFLLTLTFVGFALLLAYCNTYY
jgi:hypothetical protein